MNIANCLTYDVMLCWILQFLLKLLIFLSTLILSESKMLGYTGQSTTQISIFGKGTSLSQEEHTNEKTWRQVWTPVTGKLQFIISFTTLQQYHFWWWVLTLLDCLFLNICSLEMQGAIHCCVAIIYLHHSLKIPLFLV